MASTDYVDEVISALFDDVDPKIAVVGVGGAGGNVVSALYEGNLEGVETVAVNTDPSGLTRASAETKILLRFIEALGTPVESAAAAAEEADNALRDVLGCDIVFIVAGLGGAAGTGAAPVVTEIAKSAGAVAIGVAILPLTIEGRDDVAAAGLARLKEVADTVVIVDNNSLQKVADTMPFREAAALVTKMVQAIIEGVVGHLHRSYYSTVLEEVESVAREVEAEVTAPIDLQVAASPTVEATWEIGPVAFGHDGYIGLR